MMVAMNWKWIRNRRTVAVAVSLVLGTILMLRNTGVSEIHRTREPVNFAVLDARPVSGDWPWWRGIDQSNTLAHENAPVQWSASDNSGWVVQVPGPGRSALCTWGGQLFLPIADTDRESLSMRSLDSGTGQLLWQTELHRDSSISTSSRRSQASTTPPCDGERVFLACAVNGSLWVSAVDLTGRIAWQREAGPYFSQWGYGSSPAIYKSLVIVASDNQGAGIKRLVGSSFLAALHRQTGEIVWRIRRPAADGFGTPVVAHVAGRDQLLLAGKHQVCSFDPLTGESLWTCQWSADRVANSVAFDDRHVYASARQPQPELVCIRADGTGDVTRTHVVWRGSKPVGEFSSPVVCDGRLYTTTDDGLLTCLEAGTGQPLWKRQLGGTLSSTPVIAGQHLYCGNEEGMLFVVRLSGRGEIVAGISLGEGIHASPVISHDRLYLRTPGSLRCIAPPETDSPLASQPDTPKRRR